DDPAARGACREYAFVLRVGCDAEAIVAGNVAKPVLDHLVIADIEADRNVIVVHRVGALAGHHDGSGPLAIPHSIIEIESPAREPVRAAIGLPAPESLVKVVVDALLARGTGETGALIAIQVETFGYRAGNAHQTGIGR